MATLTLKPKVVQSGPRIEWGRIGVYAVLTIGALVAVAPFFYMVTTSLKTYGSVINNNMWPWWPVGAETIQWNNYPEAIKTIGASVVSRRRRHSSRPSTSLSGVSMRMTSVWESLTQARARCPHSAWDTLKPSPARTPDSS